MKLFDVNVLVYAHREDAPEHIRYRDYLEREINTGEVFALTRFILSGFLRIVTHPKIFVPPTPLKDALFFANQLASHPHAVFPQPSARQWSAFQRLCEQANVKGNLIPDAFIASIAMDSGCTLVTTDRDYGRFSGLRWIHPLSP